MIEPLTFSGFFLLGLLVGFGHCLGMCGVFPLWLSGRGPAGDAGRRLDPLPHLQYNLGRTATYAGLGALAGLLGSVVNLGGALFGVQKAAAVFAGALLVLYAGAGLVGATPLGKLAGLAFFERWLRRLLSSPPRRPWLVGLAVGLLPCGPLYGALIAAAGLESAWRGAVGLALFGLGTIPALMALGLLGDLVVRGRRLAYALSMIVLLVMGAWFIWQGIHM